MGFVQNASYKDFSSNFSLDANNKIDINPNIVLPLNSINYASKFELNLIGAGNNPQFSVDNNGNVVSNGSITSQQKFNVNFNPLGFQVNGGNVGTIDNNGNFTCNGWIWSVTPNRVYQQNLTAATTTSTTMVALGSANSITPKFSGHIIITAELRVNNNTVGDGVSVELLNGTNVLDTETYTQEGLASNGHTLIFHYELTSQTVGTALSIALNFAAVTGGTASAKIVSFICEEI